MKSRGILNKRDFQSVHVCIGDFLCYWAYNSHYSVVEKFIKSIDFLKNIITIVIIFLPLVIGLSIGAIYGKKWDEPKYKNLKKPEYNPPNYVFGIVWPILYLAIGIIYSYALYDYKQVSNYSIKYNHPIKYITYFKNSIYWIIPILALLFNFLYIPTFFGENGLFNGYIIIILTLVFAIATLLQFYFQDNYNSNIKYYAILALLPYIIWLSFASYLSYDIYMMNK
jgi:tryptophan-rich sensory protein